VLPGIVGYMQRFCFNVVDILAQWRGKLLSRFLFSNKTGDLSPLAAFRGSFKIFNLKGLRTID